MTETNNSATVAALFDTPEEAETAIQQLIDAGFTRQQISIIAQNSKGELVGSPRPDDTGLTGHTGLEGTTPDPHVQKAARPELGQSVAGGAVLGGVGGLVLGLAGLTIPGIGPVLAAGALATTLAGAGLGAMGGGIVGAIHAIGVPEGQAHVYAEGVRRGGTLVTVITTGDEAPRVQHILNSSGAVNIEERHAEYKQSGWTRYAH